MKLVWTDVNPAIRTKFLAYQSASLAWKAVFLECLAYSRMGVDKNLIKAFVLELGNMNRAYSNGHVCPDLERIVKAFEAEVWPSFSTEFATAHFALALQLNLVTTSKKGEHSTTWKSDAIQAQQPCMQESVEQDSSDDEDDYDKILNAMPRHQIFPGEFVPVLSLKLRN